MRREAPAQVCGAWLTVFSIAKQEKRGSRLYSPEAKAAAGSEIKRFGITPQISDDAGDGPTGEGFFGDPEEIAHIGGADDHHFRRVEAKRQQSRSIRKAEELSIRSKLQIENCYPLWCQQRFGLAQGKAEAGAAISYGIREDLLQQATGQGWKSTILGFKGAFLRLRQCRLALDIGNGVPQRGEALLAIRG